MVDRGQRRAHGETKRWLKTRVSSRSKISDCATTNSTPRCVSTCVSQGFLFPTHYSC